MRRAAMEIHLDKAKEKKTYGDNIGVAVLDTGISPHPDFTYPKNRITAFFDAVHGREEVYDDNSHGTHVAGILAGNGYLSKGKYIGVAPKCNLIGVKVLDRNGNGYINHVLKGIEWVLAHQKEYKIRIVNISISSIGEEKFSEESEFVKKVNQMWEKGMVVVASAGNLGPKEQTIGAPGNSRKIITVGCSDEAFLRGGRGPTLACVKKPDVVAPGNNIVSCGVFRNGRYGYIKKSGTSMSCPMVSGAIALLLEKYPNMTNLEVKIRLKNTVKDLGKPHASQGWGMLDIQRLI